MNYKLWIDGKWQDTKGGSVMSIEDPTTGKEIAEVIDASREDVDRAVQAAIGYLMLHPFLCTSNRGWSIRFPGDRPSGCHAR